MIELCRVYDSDADAVRGRTKEIFIRDLRTVRVSRSSACAAHTIHVFTCRAQYYRHTCTAMYMCTDHREKIRHRLGRSSADESRGESFQCITLRLSMRSMQTTSLAHQLNSNVLSVGGFFQWPGSDAFTDGGRDQRRVAGTTTRRVAGTSLALMSRCAPNINANGNMFGD